MSSYYSPDVRPRSAQSVTVCLWNDPYRLVCGTKCHTALGGSGVFKRWGGDWLNGLEELGHWTCTLKIIPVPYFLPASVSGPPQGEDSLFPDAPTVMMSQMHGTKNQVTEHPEAMNPDKPFLSSVVLSGILVSYVIKTQTKI